ncbi:DMT family transporter [Mariniflexile ostreae]|uniref:DMT family transporter n=1 Tax=Mariniflexile ostreae TaxID=1520892 RepID=A0ABV5FFQ3_9FLAO
MKKALGNKWMVLIILALTWGSVFILIKKTLLVFNPYEIGALRMLFSGIALVKFGVPALRYMSKNTLIWVGITGFFGNFFPTFLFPIAQKHVSSSMAGILDTLVPVFILILGFLFFGIKSKIIQFVGAIIGFSGAAILLYFSETSSENTQLGSALLIVLATACYGLAALIVKNKLAHVPSLQLSSGAIMLWTVPSFVVLGASGFFTNFQSNPQTWGAMGYMMILGVLGTAICGVLYYKLIQDVSPVFASTVTYLLPVVAVAWGLLDGEKFTIWYLLGAVLILVGIYLIREQKKKPQHIPR